MIKNNRRAFTLIELLITMVIVGILSVVIITKWPNSVIQVAAQNEQLASGIRLAQSMSMGSNQKFRVNLYSDHYQIMDETGSPVTGFPPQYFSTGLTLTIPGILSNNYVTFGGTGEPYIDTVTPLASTAILTLTAGSNTRQILISPETGHILAQ